MADELDDIYNKLAEAKDCSSLLKKHLSRDLFETLRNKKTSLGGTLADCIRSGCENLDSSVGVYASDPEAYTVFAPLFNKVVKDYHRIPDKKTIKHPPSDFGNLEKLPFDDLDPQGDFIVSTRIRVGRSHKGYGFPPVLTTEQRIEMEKKVVDVLNTLSEDLSGVYYPLPGMDNPTKDLLTKNHFLFNDSDRFLKAAGGYNDWPKGRGIFHNEAKTFLVWVNEEDHLRIISMQKGGNLGVVYGRLVKAVKAIEEKLVFARDDKLGFLTFCPTNLGTTLRASVHIKIPNLAVQSNFKDLCDKYNLQVRGIHGEHTASEGGVYDVSNKRRLGLTEIAAVTEMYNGLQEFISLEKELARKPEKLEEMFEHVTRSKICKSLMKKYLTKDLIEKFKDTKTSHKSTLADCIRSGSWNLDSSIGIYAADPESYSVFADIFDPVIKDYHRLKQSEAITHPEPDFGNLEQLDLSGLDPDSEMIVSTRIRVGRSHMGYPFPPALTKEQLEQMEQMTVEVLGTLSDDLQGTYYPLTAMDKDTKEALTKEHFLFNDSDRFLKAAGGYNNWPKGRGIFHNEAKTFLVWVNEEDHLRIISMQKGGDLGAVYIRLIKAVMELGEKLSFVRDTRLGFLTFCPTNLGTALRASVHIKIPHLAARKDFKAVCDKLHLQARGIHGEHTISEGGVYDVSNKRRLGLTEIAAVTEMYNGLKEIIKMEKNLAKYKGEKSSSCVLF